MIPKQERQKTVAAAPQIYLSPPHMGGAELRYIQKAFDENWIAPLGPNVVEFENRVADYIDIPGALALASGTAAIHLALMALGVKAGDSVICSDATFAASCNPIRYLGATPVFVDCDTTSWCMSPPALEQALHAARKTGTLPKAAVIVDLYGLPADYTAIKEICWQYNIPIVEDAAEALGSTFGGRQCGCFGDIGIFSFNGNKIITTSGGGMAVSRNTNYIDKMRFWATQSRERAPHYEHKEIGYNYRLSNVAAGIGIGQMEVLDHHVDRRRQMNEAYRTALARLPVFFHPVAAAARPNCWLTVMGLCDNAPVTREALLAALEAAGIEARPFWKPMHLQPVFKQYPFFTAELGKPAGEFLFDSCICLPSGSSLTDLQQAQVVDVIYNVFERTHTAAKERAST